MQPRALLSCAALVATALVAGSCSSDGAGTKGDAAAGKRVFAENGCGGCHTFAAAGSDGTRGPDLDAAAPSTGRVISQLLSGGGLMPRFAGRLSDKQMRDVAAFVGSTAGSGKAVAAPFKPDAVRLSDCAGQKPDCLEQAFGNIAFRAGPKAALARLTATSGTDTAIATACHRIAHRIGSAALIRFKGRVAPAFVAGSPVCASGYYHGIVERAFLGQPRNRLGAVAGRLCRDPQIDGQTFLSYQCIHGLGHGLMLYTGYDMPGSLRTCEGLKDDFTQVSCSGGVFMENFNSSYGVRSKYLRANDPIYPCNSVAERHKASCYGLVTANLLRVTKYDQRKTAAGCARSEPRWVRTCFESFGRDMSGIAGKDARKALASCRLAKAHETDCVYGVAREIVNADADGRRAGRFCARAPARARSHCFSGVGAVLAALLPEPAELRQACRDVGGRWAAQCRRGGGLAT